MRPPPSLDEGLEELHALQSAGPCPATTVEFTGSRITCLLPQGHADRHFGGCVEWCDPFGEVDFDFYEYWCKNLRNQERLRIYLTPEGKRATLRRP